MCVRNFVSDFAFQRTSMCAFKIDVHHGLVVAGEMGSAISVAGSMWRMISSSFLQFSLSDMIFPNRAVDFVFALSVIYTHMRASANVNSFRYAPAGMRKGLEPRR